MPVNSVSGSFILYTTSVHIPDSQVFQMDMMYVTFIPGINNNTISTGIRFFPFTPLGRCMAGKNVKFYPYFKKGNCIQPGAHDKIRISGAASFSSGTRRRVCTLTIPPGAPACPHTDHSTRHWPGLSAHLPFHHATSGTPARLSFHQVLPGVSAR